MIEAMTPPQGRLSIERLFAYRTPTEFEGMLRPEPFATTQAPDVKLHPAADALAVSQLA